MKEMNPIIETERMILRRFVAEDYASVYEFNSNAEVQKYTGDELIETIDRAKEIIQHIWQVDYEVYGYGRWAAVYKAENKVIGFAGLKYLPEVGETDIGFRFLPAYWGKGIATEVSTKIIEYGFDVLNLEKIIGIAMAENIASNKVLQNIGLSFYKIDEYDGDNGQHRWYQLTKGDYYNDVK